MIAILGMVVGVALGLFLPYQLPTAAMAKYLSVAFLAGLDSFIGAIRSDIEEKYDPLIFATGFISNALIAGILTYLGDRLGVDLYLAALVTFGVRIFENLGWIRRDLITQLRKKQAAASGEYAPPLAG